MVRLDRLGDVYLAVGAGSVAEAVRAATSARAVVVPPRGGAEHGTIEVCSPDSPLGAAVHGSATECFAGAAS